MSRVIDVERLKDAAKWCSGNHIPVYLAEDARIVRYGKFIVTRDAYLPGCGVSAKLANALFFKTIGTPLKPLSDWVSNAWERVYVENDLTPRTMPLIWFAPNTSGEVYA